MSNVKKLMMNAAGGGPLNVEDVFSTYLYQGAGTNQSITNGIDLSGNGGLVWIGGRDAGANHYLVDTERGALNFLSTNTTLAQDTTTSIGVNAFNTDGFDVDGSASLFNNTAYKYASWTFRKAPKFFDIVTYTGNNTAGRTISHNLGSVPGMIIVKSLNDSYGWAVYHRRLNGGTNPEDYYILLNSTAAQVDNSEGSIFWGSAPTSTEFTVGGSPTTNKSGTTYVAYLFAHNDGDGEFGPNGDADIIKCGNYTGNGSGNGPEIDLGFEPQWIMIKETTTVSGNGGWFLADSIRGADEAGYAYMRANGVAYENYLTNPYITIKKDGFKINQNDNTLNEQNQNYIYIAIRRGPMAVPESATDVFATDTWGGTVTAPPAFYSGWPVDAVLNRSYATTANNSMPMRMGGNKAPFTNTDGANGTFGSNGTLWDLQDGFWDQTGTASTYVSHMWRKAPNFFDSFIYKGNATAGHTIRHDLGVAPEMIWIKSMSGSQNWAVYHSGAGNTKEARLNQSSGFTTSSTHWNNTSPTDTVFTLGTALSVNSNNSFYHAFLFASLDGIAKVGTYTGTGSDQNIDCGFSNGARFVMIKARDFGTEWYVLSEGMGFTSGGTDPIIILNSNSSEDESYTTNSGNGIAYPYSSGFVVNGSNNETNSSGRVYIFYAIA